MRGEQSTATSLNRKIDSFGAEQITPPQEARVFRVAAVHLAGRPTTVGKGDGTMSEFVGTLRELRRGGLLSDCEAHLTDLVMAVRETGRPGAIVLTLKIAPASKGNVETVLVTDDVKVKRPRAELGATIFFATTGNTLRRNDPRQPELSGLREVVPMPPREEQAK